MRILIYHMRYRLDATGTGPLVADLATDLAALGDDVRVVTSVPHYGMSEVPDEFRGRLIHRGADSGVRLWRTTGYARAQANVLHRGLDYMLYSALSVPAGIHSGACDVVLGIAPPITVGPVGWATARLRRCPFVFVAQDIWPDGLISMGNLRSRSAIAAFRLLEKIVYRVSSSIVVVSEGMKENLTAKGVPAAKIEVIPNWVDTDVIQPMERQNAFRTDLGLTDRFVVLFAGNLGFAADLERVLGAARLLRGESRFVFLLVGSGSAKPALMQAAEGERLSNVVFVPTQPANKLPEILAASDLSLVTLKKDMGRVSVPSKIYSYMASARAILACVPASSEAKRLIEESGCGVWVPPDAQQALAQAIVEMSRDPSLLELMGQRGRQYAMKHCSRSAALAAYHRLLHDLVQSPSSGKAGSRRQEGAEG